MSAADVTPERFAELRLLEKHLCASGQMVGACLRESLAALESAWAERDAYLDEVRMTNENEARIMADLLATREERDRLRAELDRLSAQGGEVPELTEEDENAARNEWAKGSNLGTIRFGYDLARSRVRPAPPHPDTVELSREEWEALLDFAERIVPIRDNLSGISWVGKLSDVFAAYDNWYALRAGRPIPSDRVLKEGEVAIRADVLSAMEGCIATLRADDELIPSKALAHLDALRSKGGE